MVHVPVSLHWRLRTISILDNGTGAYLGIRLVR